MRIVPLTASGRPNLAKKLPKKQLERVRNPVARALLEALRRTNIRRPKGIRVTAAVFLGKPPYLAPTNAFGVGRVVFFALDRSNHANTIGELPLSSAARLHERLGTQGLQQWCLDCIRSGAETASKAARLQAQILGEIMHRNGGPLLPQGS